MRLFIGIGLPTPIAESLAQSARGLIRQTSDAKIRWTPPANMHITLSFLGQVHEARLDVIQRALATIGASHIKLALDGFGTFERTDVLYANIAPSPALAALAEQVVSAMQAMRISPRKPSLLAPHHPRPNPRSSPPAL